MNKISSTLKQEAKSHHLIITGFIIILIFSFSLYKTSEAVLLDPKNAIEHTTIVYYDGHFSEKNRTEDINTALYVLNETNELIYATVYEYDKFRKERATAVQILGGENQFLKTEGPGVIVLFNSNNSATSTIKFSKWAKFKRFYLPAPSY